MSPLHTPNLSKENCSGCELIEDDLFKSVASDPVVISCSGFSMIAFGDGLITFGG